MQNKKGILILIVIFILFIPTVLSIQEESILDFYHQYYGWIDFALYILIFVGIIQEFMNYRFKKGIFGQGDLGSGSKAVSYGLGLALAISLATWEVKSGFYLFQLGPLILIILAFLAILWLLGWLRSKDKSLDLGLLKKALFYIMILALIIYFFFPSLIYDYLPWSWAHTLFGVLAVITFLILLFTLGKHGAEAPEISKPGRFWDRRKSELASIADRLKERKERERAHGLEKERLRIEREKLGKEEREREKLKEYAEYLKKGIKVYITTVPTISHLRTRLSEYYRGVLKTFYVKAGYPLELHANVEGGSEDYRYTWVVKPNVPFRLAEGGRVAIIPTRDLQEAKDEELIKLEKTIKIKKEIGVYRWIVNVQDRKVPKNKATDDVRIIITRNPELEKKQLKILEEKREIKINSTIHKNKQYEKGGVYLLPLDEPVKLICEKKGTFEEIRWFVEGTTLGRGESIDYTFPRNKFKKGKYLLEVEGNYKNIKKTNSRTIYLKSTPQIDTKIFREVWNEENKKHDLLEIIPSSEKEYVLDTKLEYKLILELKEDKEDKALQNKIEKFEIKPELPGKGEELSEDKKRIIKEIIKLGEGHYHIKIELIIRDKFGYEEPISLDLRLNIIGEKREEEGAPLPPSPKKGIKGPAGIVPGHEKIDLWLDLEYIDENKKFMIKRIPQGEIGKIKVDKDSTIILKPNYTKTKRTGEYFLPIKYNLDWILEPINNLGIIDLKPLRTYNRQIISKIEQKVDIFCNIKYGEDVVASAKAEIDFKSDLYAEKEYEYFKEIYFSKIKDKTDKIFKMFEEEKIELEYMENSEEENSLYKIAEKCKELLQDKRTFVKVNYLPFLKKLEEITKLENKINEALLDLTDLKDSIPDIFKIFKNSFENFINDNKKICDQIKYILNPKEWTSEKIIYQTREGKIDHYIKEKTGVFEEVKKFRKDSESWLIEFEKNIKSSEGLNLANAFRRIFWFFR